MRYFSISISIAVLLASCGQTTAPESDVDLHPFVGCWENENGLEREVWTIDPSGWLIGYAASRDENGNITFFEHMRVERSKDLETLVVTGQDNSETRFIRRVNADASEYRFENSEHDYPQVIIYKRNGDALNAYIALMDGTKKVSFDKSACKRN